MTRYDEDIPDEEAQKLVEIGELKQHMLDALDYGPGNAKTGSQLQDELEELDDDYDEEQYQEAWRQLQEEDEIEQMNGWWYRIDGVGWR